VHGGNYEKCWGETWNDTSPMPELGPWECAAAPWFTNAAQLDKVWTESGPKSWQHIDIKQLGNTQQTTIEPTQVSGITEDVDKISFHVSEIGKPVLVRTSYFPNWEAHGAEGPYRVAPNFMVVVPTSNDVTLTYGLTKIDWLGRIGTLLGIAGVVVLVAWKGLQRYGAMRRPDDDPESGAAPPNEGDPADPGDPDVQEPVPT
jgi:hypothetical protein